MSEPVADCPCGMPVLADIQRWVQGKRADAAPQQKKQGNRSQNCSSHGASDSIPPPSKNAQVVTVESWATRNFDESSPGADASQDESNELTSSLNVLWESQLGLQFRMTAGFRERRRMQVFPATADEFSAPFVPVDGMTVILWLFALGVLPGEARWDRTPRIARLDPPWSR